MPNEQAKEEQPQGAGQELPLVERIEQFHQFMRACRSCQQDVEPHWQYCAHCGERRSTECPRCGKPLPPSGAPSCPQCGLEIPSPND